jgi:class 3 adenylate cyclase
VRTANLAIVFTDIKGFTERTSTQTLEENEKLLKTHNELLAPLFRGLGGRIVKTIGDAFMVTFESPTSAVLSGLAVQDALWAYNRSAEPGKQLHVRVAINVGEVRLEGNDVFGEPVNIAARVEGLAEADEVTFTEAVYLSMNRAEVPSEELGRFDLKGIPEPVRIYKATKWTAGPDAAPFGNKGLDRVTEGGRSSSGTHRALELASSALSTTGVAAGRALQSTSEVASRALESTSKLVKESLVSVEKQGLPKQKLLAGAGVALVVVVGLAMLGRGNPTERAIEAAASAKPEARRERIDAAKKLIAQEKDPATKAWYLGRLSEGLGETAAVGHYANAARQGAKKAEGKLIDLLGHEKCQLRSAAADALADLKVKRARGALEDLAEDGGPGDGEQVLVFGCNSKQAAADALDRLKE